VRLVFLGFSLLAMWLLLLGWAANVPFGSPWMPQEKINFSGADFQVVMGAGAIDEQHLKINAVGAESNALQSVTLKAVSAKDFPLLRYEFADFPKVLELSLVFRRADKPEDVQVIALPWPRDGKMSIDLSNIPAWQGNIIELGFAEFPTGQLVPPNYGFKPFSLENAQLSSVSWRGKLEALASDWFGAWPWSQRSVHALGRDTDTPRQGSLVGVIALGISLTVLMVGLFGVIPWRVLPKLAGVLVLAGWLVLDSLWYESLSWKHAATKDLYAGKPWEERKRLIADQSVLADAERLQILLREEPSSTRILIQADSYYELGRLIYHLLPANVAPFGYAFASSNHTPIPEGTIVVFYGRNTQWDFDPASKNLLNHDLRFPAESLLELPTFRVYRWGKSG